MRITLLALALVLALTPPLRAQDAITLNRALTTVIERYPSLDAAKAEIDAAGGRTMQSESARMLHISAYAQYNYLSFRPYVAFPSFPSLYETISNSYTSSVSAQQLLSDFGRTDAIIALARSGELSARDALEQARYQLGYETIQVFYGVILLHSSINVADEEIKALEEAERISKQKLGGGSATRFDVLTTQVRLSNAKNRITDIKAALEKQEARFRQLLGLDPEANVVLLGDFGPPPSIPSLADAITQGIENRPEMKLAKDSATSANLKVDVVNKKDRPVIAASGAAGLEDAQMPNLYSNHTYFAGAVSVSVPLFTGRRTEGEKIEARAQLRTADARVAELHRMIATDISDAISDLKAALSRVRSTDMLVDQAQEALLLAKSRYENGVITTFELLDAQSSARSAELNRLQTRFDCVIAGKALERATGQAPKP